MVSFRSVAISLFVVSTMLISNVVCDLTTNTVDVVDGGHVDERDDVLGNVNVEAKEEYLTSAGDDVVDESKEDEESDVSFGDEVEMDRRLTYYSYDKYEDKACRKYGSANYDLYYKHSKSQCEYFCNSKSYCDAYEWISSSGRCEIWRHVPDYYENKHGIDCYVKKRYYPSPTKRPTKAPTRHPSPTKRPTKAPTRHPSPTKPSSSDYYYNTWYGACRTDYGGAGSNGHEYKVVYKTREKYCKDLCDSYHYDYHHCYAYEYKESNGRCEIWWEKPGKYADKHGFKCRVKKYY